MISHKQPRCCVLFFGFGCAIVLFWLLLFCAYILVISQKFRANESSFKLLKSMPKAESPFSFEWNIIIGAGSWRQREYSRTCSHTIGADCQATSTEWSCWHFQVKDIYKDESPLFVFWHPNSTLLLSRHLSPANKKPVSSCRRFNYISHYGSI